MGKYSIHDIIYNSGDVFLPDSIKKFLSKDLIGSSRDTFYISIWSIIHLLSGVFIGFFYLFMKFSQLQKEGFMRLRCTGSSTF